MIPVCHNLTHFCIFIHHLSVKLAFYLFQSNCSNGFECPQKTFYIHQNLRRSNSDIENNMADQSDYQKIKETLKKDQTGMNALYFNRNLHANVLLQIQIRVISLSPQNYELI